jgi:Ca2+-binding RTX toxin-like protein
MAVLTNAKIKPADSKIGTDVQFNIFSTVTNSLTVDPGAFLISTNSTAVLLSGTAAWTATINGHLQGYYTGSQSALRITSTLSNKVIIGTEGSLSGDYGISSAGPVTITNAGDVFGASIGGQFVGSGPHTFLNSGTVAGGNQAMYFGTGNNSLTNTAAGKIFGEIQMAGLGVNKLVNSGTIASDFDNGIFSSNISLGDFNDSLDNKAKAKIDGAVFLGDGKDIVTNAGTITGFFIGGEFNSILGGAGADKITNSRTGIIGGSIYTDDGADVVTNLGTVYGAIHLGTGDDKFIGGTFVETVFDEAGKDSYSFGAGDDFFIDSGTTDSTDTVDGGLGVDTFRTALNVSVSINLDTIKHISTRGFTYNASSASFANGGFDIAGIDIVKSFENVSSSSGRDIIFGSAIANELDGLGNDDELWGFGGNDNLFGGSGFDTLVGGGGKDTLTGGINADTFIFKTLTDSGLTRATRDVITDFTDFSDVIDLSAIDANTKVVGNNDFTNLITGNGSFTVGTAATLRIYQTATGFMVEGEVNGDGKADFSIAVNDAEHETVWSFGDFVL